MKVFNLFVMFAIKYHSNGKYASHLLHKTYPLVTLVHPIFLWCMKYTVRLSVSLWLEIPKSVCTRCTTWGI